MDYFDDAARQAREMDTMENATNRKMEQLGVERRLAEYLVRLELRIRALEEKTGD